MPTTLGTDVDEVAMYPQGTVVWASDPFTALPGSVLVPCSPHVARWDVPISPFPSPHLPRPQAAIPLENPKADVFAGGEATYYDSHGQPLLLRTGGTPPVADPVATRKSGRPTFTCGGGE
jgi:hypothetical protein